MWLISPPSSSKLTLDWSCVEEGLEGSAAAAVAPRSAGGEGGEEVLPPIEPSSLSLPASTNSQIWKNYFLST